jgi:hypothetical protein
VLSLVRPALGGLECSRPPPALPPHTHSTNQTSSAIPTTSITKTLSVPCDIVGTFAFELASKVPSSLVFLAKNFTLPINPLASCPKSRCSVSSGTTAFAGLPVYDLFSGMGVLPNLTPSNTLNFSITALPKVCGLVGHREEMVAALGCWPPFLHSLTAAC